MRPATHLGRVCFATPGVYPLLTGRAPQVSGGSELRALRFLRGLDAAGRFDLSLIAFDHAKPLVRRVGGIRVVHDPLYKPASGGLVARLAGAVRRRAGLAEAAVDVRTAWQIAGAQLYVAFGVAEYSGLLAKWAAESGRHMLLFAGSDADFSEAYRPDATGRNWYGSRFDLCHAAVAKAGTIVVQTERQRLLAQERFGRSARVIANPIELSDGDARGVPDFPTGHALWVGKANAIKRPALLIDLARACPDVPFMMVMNPADMAMHREIVACLPPNVRHLDHASAADLAGLFAGAFCLVNTSVWEGFPNTFLEAGRHRVPVVAHALDPDGVIERHAAGRFARGDMAAMADAVRTMHRDREAARRAGANLGSYVRARHRAAERIAEFDALLGKLLGHGTAS